MMSTVHGVLILLLATAVWGSTFAVLKILNQELTPALIVAGRFWVATIALLPVLWWRRQGLQYWKHVLKDGFMVAMWLLAGYGTQTIALETTSANRAAFLTALSVVLIPVWIAVAQKRRLPRDIWIALPLAVIGLALLSWEGGPPVIGDAWALMCAITYTGFVVMLEKKAPDHKSLDFAFAQVFWVAIVSSIWVLIDSFVFNSTPSIQTLDLTILNATWIPLLYLGLLSSAFTTWLQTLGQKLVNAAQAGLIYSLEPVMAAGFSFVLLGETLQFSGFLGALLVVGAMILSSRVKI